MARAVSGSEIVAVIVGGMLGTGLRLAIDTALPHDDTGFPFSTLFVNVGGSFALAVLVARVWPVAAGWLKAALGAGLLGSFTTFSALALSLTALAVANEWMLALTYLAASLVLGLAAAWLGLWLARPAHGGPAPIDEVDE